MHVVVEEREEEIVEEGEGLLFTARMIQNSVSDC
jgi:hypothetical protein